MQAEKRLGRTLQVATSSNMRYLSLNIGRNAVTALALILFLESAAGDTRSRTPTTSATKPRSRVTPTSSSQRTGTSPLPSSPRTVAQTKALTPTQSRSLWPTLSKAQTRTQSSSKTSHSTHSISLSRTPTPSARTSRVRLPRPGDILQIAKRVDAHWTANYAAGDCGWAQGTLYTGKVALCNVTRESACFGSD